MFAENGILSENEKLAILKIKPFSTETRTDVTQMMRLHIVTNTQIALLLALAVS